MKYKKKPLVVTAIQYNGDNIKELVNFAGRNIYMTTDPLDVFQDIYVVKTTKGNQKINVGDYLIKGTSGDFYPRTEERFNASYERLGIKMGD